MKGRMLPYRRAAEVDGLPVRVRAAFSHRVTDDEWGSQWVWLASQQAPKSAGGELHVTKAGLDWAALDAEPPEPIPLWMALSWVSVISRYTAAERVEIVLDGAAEVRR